MSTKIYTGFCMRTRSWPEAYAHARSFQKEVMELQYAARCGEIADGATLLFDRMTLGLGAPPETPTSPFMAVAFPGRKEEPPKCTVCFYPFRGAIFGTVHSSIGAFESLWLKSPFLKPWPYWNNTDAPEGVSDDAWAVVGDVWDKIFGYDLPDGILRAYHSMAGLCIECLLPYGEFPTPEDVLAHVPALRKRATATAKEVFWRDWMYRVEGAPPAGVKDYMEFQAWCKGEGTKSVAAMTEDVLGLLKPEITKEDLLTEVQDDDGDSRSEVRGW